jgi:hypothetical protein
MMVDGIELKERMMIVGLGITTEGVKVPLGLWEGSTENATVATALLSDLVERGLDPEQGMLFVIDGSKAIRRAIKEVFGKHALVHRCHRHKAETFATCCPSATATRSAPASAGRGGSRTTSSPSSDSNSWSPGPTAAGPTPPSRCAKGSMRR